MYRNIITQLKEWKGKAHRKPLVLAGARQVGKTFMLTEFGKQEFENVAYINCDDNDMAKDLFLQDYDMQRIILAIGAITQQNIIPGKTLIVLDEIQELRRGWQPSNISVRKPHSTMWLWLAPYWASPCIRGSHSLLGK